MSNTSLLATPSVSLKAIADIADLLPEWHVESIDTEYNVVTFDPYILQHPLGYPPDALRTAYTRDIKVKWNDSTDTYTIKSGYNTDDITVDADLWEIREVVIDLSEDRLETAFESQLKSIRTRNSRLATDAVEVLKEKFGSLYNAMKTPKSRLKSIEGLGEKRIQALKRPENGNTHNPPNWCWHTVCPECSEEFWSVIKHYDEDYDPIDTPPAIEKILERTYCPNCRFTDFTPTYLMEAKPFTRETTLQTSRSTSINSDSGNTTLQSFN